MLIDSLCLKLSQRKILVGFPIPSSDFCELAVGQQSFLLSGCSLNSPSIILYPPAYLKRFLNNFSILLLRTVDVSLGPRDLVASTVLFCPPPPENLADSRSTAGPLPHQSTLKDSYRDVTMVPSSTPLALFPSSPCVREMILKGNEKDIEEGAVQYVPRFPPAKRS